MSLRLAVATEDFGSSLRKSIVRAARTHVAGVRLNVRSEVPPGQTTDSALRQLVHYIREQQMQVAGLICPTRQALPDPQYLEERLDLIRQSMDLVRKLHTTELLVRCGRIPDPESDQPVAVPPSAAGSDIHRSANPFSFGGSSQSAQPAVSGRQQFTTLCEILNDLTRYGNHVGCVLNLTLASYDVKLTRQLLSAVKAGPLAIAYDPATAVMTGSDVVSVYRDLYAGVGYVRARDAVRDVDGAGVEVGVGEGNVDWTQFLPTLLEADYNGWICVERTGGDDRPEDVAVGVTRLQSLIPQPVD